MLEEPKPMAFASLVKFDSLNAMRLHLRELVARYEQESDMYGHRVGVLMRIREKQERAKEAKPIISQNWERVGMLMVNNKDPLLGTLEVMLEAMEDCKAKIGRITEVLKKFDELEDLNIPDDSFLTVYMRQGVPLRLVIDSHGKTPRIDQMVALQA